MKTKKDILQARFIAARNIWLDSVSQCGKLQWEQRKTIKAQYADMQSASTALTDDETQAHTAEDCPLNDPEYVTK